MLKLYLIIFNLLIFYGCGTNFEPQIKSLSAEPNPVSPNESVILHCIASDDDEPNLLKNESLNYLWFTAYGDISINDVPEMATWIAPIDTGKYSISCKVTDQYNGADIITIEITVQ